MIVIAEKNTQVVLNHYRATYPELNTVTLQNNFISSEIIRISSETAIPEVDLRGFWIDEDDMDNPTNTGYRLMAGHDFDLTWVTNEITAIDFTPEDSKGWAGFVSDVVRIADDGTEEAEITITAYESDGTTVDTSINVTKYVSIKTPIGIQLAKMTTVSGIGTFRIKLTNITPIGHYTFPSVSDWIFDKAFRVKEVAEFDIYLQTQP